MSTFARMAVHDVGESRLFAIAPIFTTLLLLTLQLLSVSSIAVADDTPNAQKLLALAKQRFGTLTAADVRLFCDVANAKWADYTTGSEENDKILRADRIAWLCTDRQAREFVTQKGIRVARAYIGGELDLDNIDINFWLEFWECTMPQGMSLRHACVGGLHLAGCQSGPISADGIKVAGDLYLRNGFRAKGEVRLPGAEIGGDIDCEKGEFSNPDGDAFNAGRIKVAGSVFLRNGFRTEGEMNLLGANVGGNLDCINGRFSNAKGRAFVADGIKVEGSVNLWNGFRAEGEVRLLGADIGGDFGCQNGQFSNPGGHALGADRIRVAGSVFLREGFKAEGEVGLLGANLGGNLDCANGQFSNGGSRALFCDNIRVAANVYLRNDFKAEGIISFVTADVEGSFACAGIDSTTTMILDLRAAKVGTFCDDKASWPDSGNLYLDGFTYGRLDDRAPRDAKSRIEWLRRQSTEQFLPQPYEQLAKVLREGGHEGEAKKILIAKEEDPARLRQMNVFQWAWHYFEKLTICYGYRPWYALIWAIIIVLAGWGVFARGMNHVLIAPTSEAAYALQPDTGEQKLVDTYPRFSAFFYSLDVFLPIIDLHQEKYWLPHAERGSVVGWLQWVQSLGISAPTYGSLLRCYMWLQILAGWVLTSLFIAGLTRSVRS